MVIAVRQVKIAALRDAASFPATIKKKY